MQSLHIAYAQLGSAPGAARASLTAATHAANVASACTSGLQRTSSGPSCVVPQASMRLHTLTGFQWLHVLCLWLRRHVAVSHALMFEPVSPGTIWDPSCFRYQSRYHCVSMYNSPNATANRLHGNYPSGLLFSAEDGVHFQQVAAVAAEQWDGIQFAKPFVRYLGTDSRGVPQWVMNHGTGGNPQNKPPASAQLRGCPGSGQCMRWLRSVNGSLERWTPLYSSHPDPRWYEQNMWSSDHQIQTRWDAAIMVPDPAGGWAAFPTTTRLDSSVQCGVGRMHSSDGFNWTAVVPPKISWGGVRPISMEVGGVAKIGQRYYVIGGNAQYGSYDMYTLSSSELGGPFTVSPRSFRLSGVTTTPVGKETMHSLGAFFQDYDSGETLITNYMMSSNVFMTPFRRPVADSAGNLRLAFWPGNRALFGAAVAGFPSILSVGPMGPTDNLPHGIGVTWFGSGPVAQDWNHTQGLAVMGTFTVCTGTAGVGFAFEAVGPQERGPPGTWTARPTNSTRLILVGVEPVEDRSRQTVIVDVLGARNVTMKDVRGEFACGSTVCEDATLSSVNPNTSHSFVLLARRGMFELYVDDMLVQYYTYGECAFTQSGATYNVQPPYNTSRSAPCCCGQCRECQGRIGIAVNGTNATFTRLHASRMSLNMFAATPLSPTPPPAPPPPPSPPPAIPTCGGEQDADTLQFGDSKIGFHFSKTHLALKKLIVCDGARSQNLVVPAGAEFEGYSLWLLNITNCTKVFDSPSTALQLDCFSARSTVTTAIHQSSELTTLTLRWANLTVSTLPGVIMAVNLNITVSTLRRGRATLRSAATLSSRTPHACFESVALPNLPSLILRSSDTEQMFLPYFFGHAGDAAQFCPSAGCSLNEADVIASSGEGQWQPNGDQTMQWVALWSKPSNSASDVKPIGLYLGNHDPVGRLQLMMYRGRYQNESDPDDTGVPAGFRLLHVADQALNSSVKKFELHHDVVLESFQGDWYDAAMIYRRWVLPSAEWTQAGNLLARVAAGTYPKWLLDIGLWSEGGGDTSGYYAIKLQKVIALTKQGFFWNWWNCAAGKITAQCPTCCGPEGQLKGNPSSTPAEPAQFAAVVTAMEAASVYAFPYVNGRLMSNENPDWQARNAEQFACSRGPHAPRGAFFAENYGGTLFPVMDPSSSFWQDYMGSVAANLTHQFPGLGGLYLDQVAGTYAEPCMSNSSSSSSSWARGNRAMLSAVTQAISPNRAVVSESNAEAYMSSLHGYFAYYAWLQCGYVPAWQAVYGGYALNIGAVGWGLGNGPDCGPNCRGFSSTFRSLLATEFVWGSALGGDEFSTYYGWLYFKNDSHVDDRDFLKELIEMRLRHADLLIHGRLMRPPNLLNTSLPDAPVMQPEFQKTACNISQPTAQTWKSQNESLALVIANFASVPADFAFEVDASDVWDANVTVSVCCTVQGYTENAQAWLAPESHVQVLLGTRRAITLRMSLPALRSAVVRVDPCPEPPPPPSPPPPVPSILPTEFVDGATVQLAINNAVARRLSSYELPFGDVWFGNQVLQMTDAANIVIAGQFNTTLWFEVGGAVRLLRCSNVSLSSVTIDYYHVPYVQATITSVVKVNSTHASYDLVPFERSLPMMHAVGQGPGKLWGPNGELKWQNPRFPPQSVNTVPAVVSPLHVNNNTWRLLLPFITNASVDDLVTYQLSAYQTLCVANSSRVTVQNMTIHSASSFAIMELDGLCGHVFRHVRVVRRHPYLIASNRDVFHSIDCQTGALIENSEFSRSADDYINIHSTTHVLMRDSWQRLLLLAPRIATGSPPYTLTDEWYGTTSPLSNSVAGRDTVSCYSISQSEIDPLQRIERFVIASLTEVTLQLNASVSQQLLSTPTLLNAPPYNATPALMTWAGVRVWYVNLAASAPATQNIVAAPALCSIDRFSAAGPVIQQNVFRDPVVAAGVRLKSPGGRITSNQFVRSLGLNIEIASLQSWLEGPVAIHSIATTHNMFINSSARHGGDAFVAVSPQDTDILVSNNTVLDSCGERGAPTFNSTQGQYPCTTLPFELHYSEPACSWLQIDEASEGWISFALAHDSTTEPQHRQGQSRSCWNFSSFEASAGYDSSAPCAEAPPYKYAGPSFGKALSRGPTTVCIGGIEPVVTVVCEGVMVSGPTPVVVGKPLRLPMCKPGS